LAEQLILQLQAMAFAEAQCSRPGETDLEEAWGAAAVFLPVWRSLRRSSVAAPTVSILVALWPPESTLRLQVAAFVKRWCFRRGETDLKWAMPTLLAFRRLPHCLESNFPALIDWMQTEFVKS
jgi:hypothetical protein